MFNFDVDNYINNVAETPHNHYRGLNKATIISQWENTTQLYTIKEQIGLPFVDEYEECECWVDTVSDALVNYSKTYSDFVRILYNDFDHKQNYKGQYYKLCLDGEHEETYICYDRVNKLTQTYDFKCVRCNNVLTWVDKNNNIITMPCYVGNDISATNNLISKSGITPNVRMVIFTQANEYTKTIIRNQRFMFQHSTAFKVEEIDNYSQEGETNGEITYIKMYISQSPILPIDDIENNICDRFENNFELNINQDNISQVVGFKGNLSATIKNNDEVIDGNVVWSSSDENIVFIDENGNYELKGNIGDVATIICSLKSNPNINDTIEIDIVSQKHLDKNIIISPMISSLLEGESVEFDCNVYLDGVKQTDSITCLPNWIDNNYYILSQIGNKYKLTNKHISNNPLTLTFKANGCNDVNMEIHLNGIFF